MKYELMQRIFGADSSQKVKAYLNAISKDVLVEMAIEAASTEQVLSWIVDLETDLKPTDFNKWIPVQSSSVHAVRYNPDLLLLDVWWVEGKTRLQFVENEDFRPDIFYRYSGVSNDIWQELNAATSLGAYLPVIKSQFQCEIKRGDINFEGNDH